MIDADAQTECQEAETKTTSEEVQLTTIWWEVLREAKICGQLENCILKGKTGQKISFDWTFVPSENSAASRSPWFDWVGMSWSIRFQRSPFEPGILHPPARSIFVDLRPPFRRVFRVTGCISLEFGQKSFTLWKFDEKFEPAWKGQEICTWCCRRLNLERIIQEMQGREIHLHVKLCTKYKGRPFSIGPVQHALEKLPFTLKIGTTTLATRYGWDLRRHLNNFSPELIFYWKSLKESPRKSAKVKFGPRDLAKAVDQFEIAPICTWKGCKELKSFIITAVHDTFNGFVVIPYHLVFLGFDLMDGSGDDDDPKEIEVCGRSKHQVVVALLDWIVENPLVAAFEKEQHLIAGQPRISPSFMSAQEHDHRARQEEQGNAEAHCSNCNKNGAKKSFLLCGHCRSRCYCNRTCQRSHWKKLHKKECKTLAEQYDKQKQLRRAEEAHAEEEMALNIHFKDPFKMGL